MSEVSDDVRSYMIDLKGPKHPSIAKLEERLEERAKLAQSKETFSIASGVISKNSKENENTSIQSKKVTQSKIFDASNQNKDSTVDLTEENVETGNSQKTIQKTTNVVPTSVDIMDSKLPTKDNVSNIEKQTNIVDLITTKESSFSQSSFLEENKEVTNDHLFKVPRKSKDKNQSFSSRSKPNFSQQSDTQYNYDPSYLYRKDKNRLDQRSGRQSILVSSVFLTIANKNYELIYPLFFNKSVS